MTMWRVNFRRPGDDDTELFVEVSASDQASAIVRAFACVWGAARLQRWGVKSVIQVGLWLALVLMPAAAGAQQAHMPLSGSLKLEPPCHAELLAASQEWARIMGPGTWTNVESVTEPSPISMRWEFKEYGGTTMQQAEQRWRRAIEACQ